MRLTVILAALCAVLLAAPAEARPKHRKAVQADCGFFFCPETAPVIRKFRTTQHTEKTHGNSDLWGNPTIRSARILAHPRGCPRRAFCGCGASIRVFGRSIRKLWLARNWFGFPRALPAPKKAAVRRHHVFILEQHVSGDDWLVYDANSGGGKTRLHVRSIKGYTIVDPHGASGSLASRGQAL